MVGFQKSYIASIEGNGTKPEIPQYTLVNPLKKQIWVSLIELTPNAFFSRKGKIEIRVNGDIVLEESDVGSYNSYKLFQVPLSDQELLQQKKIEVFVWNGLDDDTVKLTMNVLLSEEISSVSLAGVPTDTEALNREVSDAYVDRPTQSILDALALLDFDFSDLIVNVDAPLATGIQSFIEFLTSVEGQPVPYSATDQGSYYLFDPTNSNVRGICSYNDKIFTVDGISDSCYVYNANGTLDYNFELDGDNSFPRGIVVVNDKIYVLNATNNNRVRKIFVYDLQGNRLANEDWELSGQTFAHGITFYDGHIYTVSRGLNSTQQVQAYNFDGTRELSLEFIPNPDVINRDVRGFTVGGGYFWLLGFNSNEDIDTKKVYCYNFDGSEKPEYDFDVYFFDEESANDNDLSGMGFFNSSLYIGSEGFNQYRIYNLVFPTIPDSISYQLVTHLNSLLDGYNQTELNATVSFMTDNKTAILDEIQNAITDGTLTITLVDFTRLYVNLLFDLTTAQADLTEQIAIRNNTNAISEKTTLEITRLEELKLLLKNPDVNVDDLTSLLDDEIEKLSAIQLLLKNPNANVDDLTSLLVDEIEKLSAIQLLLKNPNANVDDLTSLLVDEIDKLEELKLLILNPNPNVDDVTSLLGDEISKIDDVKLLLSNPNPNIDDITSLITDEVARIEELKLLISNPDLNIDDVTSLLGEEISKIDDVKLLLSNPDVNVDDLTSLLVDEIARIEELKLLISNPDSNISDLTSLMIDEISKIDDVKLLLSNPNPNIDDITSLIADEIARIEELKILMSTSNNNEDSVISLLNDEIAKLNELNDSINAISFTADTIPNLLDEIQARLGESISQTIRNALINIRRVLNGLLDDFDLDELEEAITVLTDNIPDLTTEALKNKLLALKHTLDIISKNPALQPSKEGIIFSKRVYNNETVTQPLNAKGNRNLIIMAAAEPTTPPTIIIGNSAMVDSDINSSSLFSIPTQLLPISPQIFAHLDYGSRKARRIDFKFALDFMHPLRHWKIDFEVSNNNINFSRVNIEDITSGNTSIPASIFRIVNNTLFYDTGTPTNVSELNDFKTNFFVSFVNASFRYLRFTLTPISSHTAFFTLDIRTFEIYDSDEFGGNARISFEVQDAFNKWIEFIPYTDIGSIVADTSRIFEFGEAISDHVIPSTQTKFRVKMIVNGAVNMGASLLRIA